MYRTKKRRWFILFAPLAIAGIALFIWVVMLLWNGVLMPATGVRIITYWQAAGILILSKILFGFGGGGPRRGRRKWAEMQEKFARMSPEEKERFKAECRTRYGRWSGRNEWGNEQRNESTNPAE